LSELREAIERRAREARRGSRRGEGADEEREPMEIEEREPMEIEEREPMEITDLKNGATKPTERTEKLQ